MDRVRVDRWLWAVRISKTRTLAAISCERGNVYVNQTRAKASRMLTIGDEISVKRDGINWLYKVKRCIDKRVGAAEARECREDLTPQEEIDRVKMIRRMPVPRRPKGAGRPTKKERRQLDSLWQNNE